MVKLKSLRDIWIRKNQDKQKSKEEKEKEKEFLETKHIPDDTAHMFLSYNPSIRPPYRIIIDTNFITQSISNWVDIFKGAMDCLLSKVIIYFTDCVEAELEKLKEKTKLSLRLIKDPWFQRITCTHKGTYADDCIVNYVTNFRCFIVATNDKDLK